MILPSNGTLPPGGDYPTYLGNEERTSATSSDELLNLSTAPEIHLLWNYSAGAAIQSQPVEQNGTVYFGAVDGYEYAVQATTGRFLWKTFLGQDKNDSNCHVHGVTSTATVSGENLYVDGGYPYLYALNLSTGNIEWRGLIGGSDSLGYYDWSSPLIYNQSAYVGISSNCDLPLVPAGLAKFSLITHLKTAFFNSSVPDDNGSSIWGSPSVNPATNTVFVATGNEFGSTPSKFSESVISLNATTLAVEHSWQVPVSAVGGDSDFGVTPTLFTPAGGYPMVAAANKNGLLYSFYQSDLTLAWQQRVCCLAAEDDHFSTAWGGGTLYAVGADSSVGGESYNSSVHAFDPLTNTTIWRDGFQESSYGGYAAPLWVNGVLIVPDGNVLLFLDAGTGGVVHQVNVGGETQAAAAVARGELFVGSTDGCLLSFDVQLNSTATESPINGTAPLAVTFDVSGSGGLPAYAYQWNFGDGTNSSTTQTAVHVFRAAGTYTVRVDVTDQAGNVSSRVLQVTVFAAPSHPASSALSPLELLLVLGGTLVLVALVIVIVIRRRSSRSPPESQARDSKEDPVGRTSEPKGPGSPPEDPPPA